MQTDRGIYLALAELTRRHRDASAPAVDLDLTRSELRCFSQHGEDGVVAEILRRIGVSCRYFVEFGVESGREGNCVFLSDVLGWSGLYIEAEEGLYASLERKYAASPAVVTAHAAVTPENVQDLFSAFDVPNEFDVLSIDVDGPDYWIWERITDYRPRLMVIEYNSSLPVGRRWVQPQDQRGSWQGTDFFGASLDALSELGSRLGYQLVHTDLSGTNAFFVRTDLATGLFPTSAEVPRRTEPNYFLQGHRHPRDTTGRTYSEVGESGAIQPDRRLPRMTASRDSAAEASALVARTDFIWHQHFEIAPGIFTPGPNDVGFLCSVAGIPDRLTGESVLDIGTTNGGFAFELEQRGAGRVVAVDILDPDTFGFNAIKAVRGSRVEHVQASIYELPEILGEEFDLVLFLGVIYHLRHPLLALDNVRRLTREMAFVESAICDGELPEIADRPMARFYRRDELGADPTNWFAPTLSTLADWCASCGLEPVRTARWPDEAPSRGLVAARRTAGAPEWQEISYEVPLITRVQHT